MQKKLMIFHPTIAPYRVDFFNDLYEGFLTEVFLYYKNLKSQKFNYKQIENKFRFMPHYMKKLIGFGDRELYKGSIKEILKNKPDIVIVGEYGFGTWAAVIARLLSGDRFKIISICDDSEKIANDCSGLRKFSRNILMKYLDGLILCSYNAQKWYDQHFNIETFVFPIIRKEKEFRDELKKAIPLADKKVLEYSLKGKRIFVFIGRLVKEKNVEYLITSFVKACRQYKDIRLFVIGEENDNSLGIKKRINDLINENQADGQIQLLGRLEGNDLNAWLNIGQVLVLPSVYEPFGAVTNEALLAGQYVMVSKNAGSAGLVNQENGEILDIEREYIDFQAMIGRLNPLSGQVELRESKMLYSYKELMGNLKAWINKLE